MSSSRLTKAKFEDESQDDEINWKTSYSWAQKVEPKDIDWNSIDWNPVRLCL